MKIQIKIFLSLIAIYCLVLVTACPKEPEIRRAAKASYELSGLTLDAVNATAKAYQAGLIDAAAKDRIANALKIIAIGGKRFNQTLKIFVRESGEKLPKDKLDVLNKIFSDEVIEPFLEILHAARILSADKAAYLHAAINALRAAILIVSSGFSAAEARAKFDFREVQNYA